MEQAECSETSAYKIQAPGNYPEENIQVRTSHGFPRISFVEKINHFCSFNTEYLSIFNNVLHAFPLH